MCGVLPARRVSSRKRGRALVAIGSRVRCGQKAIAPTKPSRRVKISERRDAAASGESGGRWHGARRVVAARASHILIDATSARSRIDRDARWGPRDGSEFGGKRQIEICRRSRRNRSRRGRRTGGLGGDVGAESHLDAAGGLAADGHVEEAHGVGHGVLSGCSRERARGRVTVTRVAKTLFMSLLCETFCMCRTKFVWEISHRAPRGRTLTYLTSGALSRTLQ